MAKPRPTLPIAHADDLPTSAFTDEEWQANERAYARQLNADVRQQITTVTTQYLKDCVFERTAAPKAMARERLQRIRREVGDLEKVMRDSKPLSASTDELPTEQQEDSKPLSASTDELPTEQQEDSKPLSASTDKLPTEQQQDSKPLSASTDELPTEQQEDSKPLSASTDELPTEQQEDSKPFSASTDKLPTEQQ